MLAVRRPVKLAKYRQWIKLAAVFVASLMLGAPPALAQDGGIFDGIRDPFVDALDGANSNVSTGVENFFTLITGIFAFLAVISFFGGLVAFNQSRDFVQAFAPFLFFIAFAVGTPIVIGLFTGA